MRFDNQPVHQYGRRAFLRGGTLFLAAAASAPCSLLSASESKSPLRVGLVTDLHYADKPSAGTRYYRETLDKLAEAASHFEKSPIEFVVEMGDLIDAADSVDTELSYLKTINREFAAISKDRHYVLGNHCVDTLTKAEFLNTVEHPQSYYSFTWTDANIPSEELEWLQADLQSTNRPTFVFAHQRLDVSNSHGVKNCHEVRQVLEASNKVLAVFQGHSHKNELNDIGGIHYCTLAAMIEGSGAENNSYSIMEIAPTGTIQLTGFRQQKSYDWKSSP